MHRRNLAGIVLLLSAYTSAAQDIEPEDPGIVLPPVLLEVEDLQVEDVRAALPDDEDQLRPDVSIPLPEAEDLYLPEEAFDIPYPDQMGVAQGAESVGSTEYVERPRNPIFIDGRIGVGGPVYVLGDLSLYKLGDEPRFKLRFFHEKLDGYGFRQPGSGFFRGEDVLDGTLSFETEAARMRVDAEIGETSRGLQRGLAGVTAEYDSVSLRRFASAVSLSYTPKSALSLSGELRTGYVSQILAAATPRISTEFLVAPQVRGAFTHDALTVSVDGRYRFSAAASPAQSYTDHAVSGVLTGAYRLPADIRISLAAGVYWSNDGTLTPEAILGAEGRIGATLQFKTEGGYGMRLQDFTSMWSEWPLMSLDRSLTAEYGWLWNGTVQYRPFGRLLITADLGFDYSDGVVDPSSTTDPQTGLFAFEQRRMMSFSTDVSVEWDITSIFGADLSWTGRFIERPEHTPVQSVSLSFGADDPGERYGASLDAAVEFDPRIRIPTVDVGGYYRLSDSVQFELDVQDLLAPIYETGRYDWEPYIEPGLNATLTTKISL